MTDTEVTFLLTSGGHNAGIVSEPGVKGRTYQVATKAPDDRYADPNVWVDRTQSFSGSWWPEFAAWLLRRSGEPAAPPTLGGDGYTAIVDAPGTYVLQE
jgi:polyhydroxyalkanoate synthase